MEGRALLPDSVTSPRASLKMCIQLTTHLTSCSLEKKEEKNHCVVSSVCGFIVHVNVIKRPIEIQTKNCVCVYYYNETSGVYFHIYME